MDVKAKMQALIDRIGHRLDRIELEEMLEIMEAMERLREPEETDSERL